MKRLKKMIVLSVMMMTVFSMSVVVAPEASAASAGDLIKMDGLSSVYYLGADGKRYVFPNESTYFSWYSDFSGVVTISQSELESYNLGKNVTMRPGTSLVKITTNPNVYAVTPGGDLLLIPSEEVAMALYGEAWASRVVDIADSFFTNYEIASGEASADMLPAGSLAKFGGADVYYIDADGSARLIVDEAAFEANRFNFGFVIDSSLDMPAAGDDVTAKEDSLSDTAQGAGGQAGAGTGVSVALASDTPAAGNVPTGASVEVLKFNVSASNDGDVNINSIKLSAFGLGSAGDIDAVAFYDNGVKVGTSKDLNASDRYSVFNFSTPINIPAGSTKALTVKATLANTSNYAVGIKEAGDIMTNGAVVSGSFPIEGNVVSGVTASLGAFDFDNVETTDTNNQFGEDNVLLAAFDVDVTATEDVLLGAIRLRNGGTNSNDIVSNISLVVDGDEVQSGLSIVDRYVNLDAGGYLIEKGNSASVEVYGDIGIGNANDTIGLYMKEATDISVVGKTFGYELSATADTDLTTLMTSNGAIVVTLDAGDFAIDMDKTATPAKDIRADSTNVVLATIKMTSNSENATLDGIGAGLTVTGSNIQGDELDSFELVDLDSGSVFDLTADGVADATFNLTMTDEVAFVKGVTKTFALRCDVLAAADVNDVFKVTLAGSALTLTGDTSDATISDITPSSVTGANQTVKGATLTWTTSVLTDKTVVTGASDVIVYQAGVKAGDVSPITITSIKLDVVADDGDVNGSFIDNNITKLDLYMNNVLVKSLSNGITEATAPNGYVTFSSLPTASRTVAAGATVPVEVKATFASSFATTSTWSVGVVAAGSVSAKDDQNTTVSASVPYVLGSRDVTLAAAGYLKATLLTDDQMADRDTYIVAGQSTDADDYLGEVELRAYNEGITVQSLVLMQSGTATGADISMVNLYDSSGSLVASALPTVEGHAFFDSLDLDVAADETDSYFIGIDAKSINANGDANGTATYGKVAQFAFASSTVLALSSIDETAAVTAVGADSGDEIVMTEDVDATPENNEYSVSTTNTKSATVTGSNLTSVVNVMDDATLTGGTLTIGKYKMVFDNAANRTATNEELKAQLVTLDLQISMGSGVSATSVQAYVLGNTTKTAVAVNVDDAGDAFADGETARITLSTLPGSALVDGEVTLVIVGNVTSAANAYLQTKIVDINTDFTFSGNGVTGGNINPLLDITDVVGGTLSN